MLEKGGHTIINSPGEAEVIIINTCGFITEAKQEGINTIFEMLQYKPSCPRSYSHRLPGRAVSQAAYGGNTLNWTALWACISIPGYANAFRRLLTGNGRYLRAGLPNTWIGPLPAGNWQRRRIWRILKFQRAATTIADTAPYPEYAGNMFPEALKASWPKLKQLKGRE